MSESTVPVIDQRLVKAMGHPLRFRILVALNLRVASPKELADEFDEPLGNVSYHVRMLDSLGCLELVDTKQRRGAVEHFYRAVTRPMFSDDDWSVLPATARREIDATLLRQIIDDVAAAARGGGFDREDAHIVRMPLEVDEEGWDAAIAVIARALDDLFEIQAASNGRLAGKVPPIRAEAVMLMFERGAPISTAGADG